VDVERQHLPPVHLRRRRRRRDLGGGGGGAPRTEAGSGEVAADEIREVGRGRGAGVVEEFLLEGTRCRCSL
jgi:hypothetical protein